MTPTERGSRRAYTSSRNRTTTCFGRTFVIANPDGNLIRVSPVD